MRRWIIRIVVVLAALAALYSILTPTVIWDGTAHREIVITVLDDNGKPISGAIVATIDDYYRVLIDSGDISLKDLLATKLARISDVDGKAIVSRSFPAGGSRGLRQTGSFRLQGVMVVQAQGYRPFESSLRNLLGEMRMPIKTDKLQRKIFLTRVQTDNTTDKP